MMIRYAGRRLFAGDVRLIQRAMVRREDRYLPMGYFNENSLGEITTITTNIMEQLGDVAKIGRAHV